tara:strand:+ start:1789 stop:1953 length:165 start_codon:yes stop_codon:yes gene_type:complete
MDNVVKLIVDTSTVKGMNKGETEKIKLENNGYNCIGVVPLGLDKWALTFEKGAK